MAGNPLNPIPGVSAVIGTSTIDPRTVVAGQQQAPAKPAKAASHERQQISQWLRQARVPSWLEKGWKRWEEDRRYVNEELFAESDDRQLTVNLAARAVQQKVSAVLPYDADCSVKHERGVGSIAIARRDAIRAAKGAMEAAGLPLYAPILIEAADAAEQRYRDELEARSRLAQTGEALVKKLWDEAYGTATARSLASGSMTVGLGWLKIGWQRDYGRDCLSRMRNEEQLDQIRLLALRSAEYATGRFGMDDAKYGELVQLSDYARVVSQRVLQGEVEPGSIPFAAWTQIAETRDALPVPPHLLPEVEAWQGCTIDIVRPEALRWDWTTPITRWREAAWVMEQNLMDVDDLAAMFGLTPGERDQLARPNPDQPAATPGGQPSTAAGEHADPDRGTFESQVQRGKIVVWERFDRRLHRRTVFVEALDRFLVDEVVRDAPPGFYRYVPLFFNDGDGAHLPHSDVRFMRKIQNAINQRLTDSQESLWASMKRYLVRTGAFREGELDKLRGARPHDVIEVDDPEGIMQGFKEIASDDWRADKYDLNGLFRLFELVSGMSISQLGVTGQANFAAEANIAQASSQQSAGRHGMAIAEALTTAMEIIMHDAMTHMSERQVKHLVGDAAYWPSAPTRSDLCRGLRVKVEAAGSRQAAKTAAGQEAREAMTALGQAIDLRARGAAAGVRVDIAPLVAAISRAIDVEAPSRDIVQVDDVSSLPPVGQMAPAAAGPGGGDPQQSPGAPTPAGGLPAPPP
ncbi:MAG: hypothetical protein VKK97_13340 [Synechococcaceae cyanobacterium]|nr:hypothetical protein [Synechococcaceae cyanobacterium]